MCTYARISLARYPSLPTGPLSLAGYTATSPSLCTPRHRARCVPHRSFVPLVPTHDTHSRRSHDPAISLITALALARVILLSPTACLRSSAFFLPPQYLLFFPQHAPEPSSDFYNLLLVARHIHTQTGDRRRRRRRCRHRRVSGTVHPEKPENREKQKRPARRAAHPAGVVRSNGTVAVTGRCGRGGEIRGWPLSDPGERRAGVADEKRKRHRGTPTQRIIRASACTRL